MAILDTTIIIDFLRQKPNAIEAIQALFDSGEKTKTTLFNYYEAYYGEIAFGKPGSLEILEGFFDQIEIVPPTIQSIRTSARIELELRKKGQVIDPNDLYIAGIAIERNETLYTNNTKDFEHISGLRVQKY
ncbi:MAG: type II toxin-antitoxin system VapC family toxin [Candidatus Diapherotrites archaeon]|nr:type II toxin-antitoxin system VapC family toxin [Candidatus Diapherotrites archaeon]